MLSVPSGSSTTTGFRFTPSVLRIATWGWLITGIVSSVPNGPGLVIVKVPLEMSSGVSFFERARDARSLMSRAMARMRLPSASRITGTMRPLKSRSTAIPRFR